MQLIEYLRSKDDVARGSRRSKDRLSPVATPRMVARGPGAWQAVVAGPSTFPRAGGCRPMTETIRRFPVAARAAIVAWSSRCSPSSPRSRGGTPSREDVSAPRSGWSGSRASSADPRPARGTQERLNEAAGRVEQQQIVLEEVPRSSSVPRRAGSGQGALRPHRRPAERAGGQRLHDRAGVEPGLPAGRAGRGGPDRPAGLRRRARAGGRRARGQGRQPEEPSAGVRNQLERQQELEVEALEEARAEKREVASLFDDTSGPCSTSNRTCCGARSAPSSARRPRTRSGSRSSAPPRRNAIGGRIWTADR